LAFTAPAAFGAVVQVRITNGGDDYEENAASGAMDSGSSDLELPYENAGATVGTTEQVIGLRFAPVRIPKGAPVSKAYVELEMDETKGNAQVVNLIVEGELIGNAPAFTTAARNITSRTRTKAQVKWTPATGMANDTKFRTPDISAIINEITSLDGWASGNALVIIIRDDKDNPSAGLRCVEAVEGEATAAPLLSFEVSDPNPSVPSPANNATGVTMPLLGWTAGDGAVFHNVYFGTTKDLTEANLVAKNQPFAMYYHVPGIEPGKTYYWRVEEIDAAGKVTAGPVWSFSTPSQKAYAPIPRNGGKNIAADVKLTWTAGHGAISHTVYFGTSFDQVANATGGTLQAATTYTPTGPLAKKTTYYWRVDEKDSTTTHKGDVWRFTTMPDVADIKITDPDLVGWWTFDEGSGTTALDFSGHGNNATSSASGTRWVNGILDGAVELTGSGYVVIDSVDDDVTGANFTLSSWIKSTQGGEGNVFALNDAASGYTLLFGIQSGNPYRWDTADAQYPPAVNDNEWHLLTYVRSGAMAYIYVDGVERTAHASAYNLSAVTRRLL
jgi:hypothetical protein